MGENSGAAGGDVVGSQELVEIAESGIDALGGLELLVIGEERSLEIENVGFPKLLGVRETKEVVWGLDGELAAATRGCAVLAASGIINGIGVGGMSLHVFLQMKGEGIPTPGVFL